MGSSLYGLAADGTLASRLGLVAAAIASVSYAASFLLARRPAATAARPTTLTALFVLAAAAHGVALLPEWLAGAVFYFGFAHAISWMVWLAALIWLVERGPASATAGKTPDAVRHWLLVASAAPLLPLVFPGVVQLSAQSWIFRLHILLAMAAYSTFAIAALQGLVMQAQERALHVPRSGLIQWLGNPSLMELDRQLARTMALGLGLLVLTLASGVAVNRALGHAWLVLDHKTVFTLLTTALGGVFWAGRLLRGWRGGVAARCAVLGLGLLLLSYVGSRFVTEVLLARAA